MQSIKIPRKNISKIDIINEPLTAKEVYAKYKPDYFINLGLYDPASGKNIHYLEDENVKSGYLFSSEGIGIKNSNDIIWTTKDIAFADLAIRDYISGSPTLVKNGAKYIDWGNKIGSHAYGSHRRSVIGYCSEYLVLCCSTSAITVQATVAMALNAGMKYAINVDGGGSCHLQSGSNVLVKSSRRNGSWLLIYMKNSNMPEQKANDGIPPNMYIVQRGDTLYSIAKKHGLDYKSLVRSNNIKNPDRIMPGQKLYF